ncbi:SH3 domain-containing protein [Streptomyces sp. NBC_00249]|uniref:SH3 domain-containing protein n=1 Tax=Streptomyces sp. NBC_00249 TaxID=2975690 RepID=UPI00224F6CD7|nr:SH3 domain-containing protein [Streptomyces sp. NBC_00249]MCX5199644.1 SH3 domain-containing protein [Streptomyces sp. NBC_00249]
MSASRSVSSALIVAAVTASCLVPAVPALADSSHIRFSQPYVPSIAAGKTGRVVLTATNGEGPARSSTFRITAPDRTTFPEARFYWNGQRAGGSCTRSSNARLLTCEAQTRAGFAFPARAQTRLAVSLRVDANAPEGVTLDGGEWATGTGDPALFAVSTPVTGPKGDDGKPGHDGHHGHDGKPGHHGKPGRPGPKGDKGDQGERGERGEKGERGDRGERGPEGPQGPKGDKGDQGPSGGPKGDKGDKGDQGDRGAQGDRGTTGDTGPAGDRGPAGPQGPKGDTGPAGGPKGDKGDRGPAGPEGPQGDTGPQGEKGRKGDKGDKGNKGNKGNKGHQGIPGPQGDRGPAGPRGEKGEKGDTGKPGKPGTCKKCGNHHHDKPSKPHKPGKPGKPDHTNSPKARIVTSGHGLGVRSGPGTHYAKQSKLRSGETVALQCKVNGETVDGNSIWYKLADGSGWIAARYAQNLGKVPYCA